MPRTEDFPVCPYCGYKEDEHDDTNVTYWGSQDGCVERECANCEKSFMFKEVVRRTYHTQTIDEYLKEGN